MTDDLDDLLDTALVERAECNFARKTPQDVYVCTLKFVMTGKGIVRRGQICPYYERWTDAKAGCVNFK